MIDGLFSGEGFWYGFHISVKNHNNSDKFLTLTHDETIVVVKN